MKHTIYHVTMNRNSRLYSLWRGPCRPTRDLSLGAWTTNRGAQYCGYIEKPFGRLILPFMPAAGRNVYPSKGDP